MPRIAKGHWLMRDGRKAVIYGPAHREPGRFLGYVNGVSFPYTWGGDGRFYFDGTESELDLLERA